MPARAAPPCPARRCAAQATSGPGAIPTSISPAGPTACDSPSSIVLHPRQRLCRSSCWPPITPALANPLWFVSSCRTTPNSPSSATRMMHLRRHLPPSLSLSVSSLTCVAPAPLPIAPCAQLCACVPSLSLPPCALLKLPVASPAHRMAGPQCTSCFPFPFLTDCGNGKHGKHPPFAPSYPILSLKLLDQRPIDQPDHSDPARLRTATARAGAVRSTRNRRHSKSTAPCWLGWRRRTMRRRRTALSPTPAGSHPRTCQSGFRAGVRCSPRPRSSTTGRV